MKNLILAIVLSTFSAVSFAADAEGEVGIVSDYLYRGQSESAEQPAIFGELTVSGVVVEGDYFRASTLAVDLDDTFSVGRSEVGVGYARQLGPIVADLSYNRVMNSVLYPADYNEARLGVTFEATDSLDIVGNVAQITTDAVPEDLYLSAGFRYSDLFVDGLNLSMLAATFHDDATTQFEFNNLEVGVEYELGRGLSAFGLYSVGGKTVTDVTDGEVNFRSRDIPSTGMVGVKYSF